MNSNKTAIAVLALAGAVVGSSLWISSRTEPSAPAESVESESNTVNSVETSSEAGISDILSDVILPETSVAVPESGIPEVDESESSVPEYSEPETSEPVRDPQGGVVEEALSVTVTVTDSDGFPLVGATVHVDELVGVTDENGVFTTEAENEEFVLHVVAEGYVSFYDEVNIFALEENTVIVLEKADTIRKLLDSVELRPYVFYDEEMMEQIDTLLDSLITPGMDTYDKVKACYDWLIANTEYKRPQHTGSGHWPCASVTIDQGIGTCNCYSAVFAAMTRRIGLNCYVAEGVTTANRGGMTGHVWTVIEIGGETYIFDPQVEDAMADRTSSKKVTYVRFCLPEPNGKYVYNGSSLSRQMRKFDEYLLENGYFLEPEPEPEPEMPDYDFVPGRDQQTETPLFPPVHITE